MQDVARANDFVACVGRGSKVGGESDTVVVGEGVNQADLVAPIFNDFVGKQWEASYPGLLGRYYDAVMAVSGGRLWGVREASGVGGFTRGVVDVNGRGGRGVEALDCRVAGPEGSSVGRDGGDESFCSDESGSCSGSVVEGVDCSESVGVGVRGKHWARNRQKKEIKKQGKRVGVSKGCPDVGVDGVVSLKQGFVGSLEEEQRKSLLSSRATMMEMQNKLAREKAERDLEVLKAVDLELEKRKNIARIRAATERSMVSIEKTHAMLVSTDNVPRDQVDHDVHTVLTGEVPDLSSGSISPNSSASMAEFRELHKRSLDLEKRNSELIEMLGKVGVSAEHFDKYDKRTWTDTPENQAILDEMYPGDIAMDYAFAPKGKFHLVV